MGIVFALMFRLLGDAILNWKATLIGGAITALLFVLKSRHRDGYSA
jgi:uncharacterized BrkB/YihY/UPF0761 family membrane protein